MRLVDISKKIPSVYYFINLLFVFLLFILITFMTQYKKLNRELKEKEIEIYQLQRLDSVRTAERIAEVEDLLIIEFIDSVKAEIKKNNEIFEQKIDSIRSIPDSVKLELWYRRYRNR